MNRTYLLIGGNMGNREDTLTVARGLIASQCGTITKSSGIYETAAWGKTDQPDFLNQALEVETTLNAKQLIRRILKVEKTMGRIRKEKYGPRLIDIDILLFNDEIHHYSFLNIPHPEIQNRRFVLLPLVEIAGEAIHPILHKSMTTLRWSIHGKAIHV